MVIAVHSVRLLCDMSIAHRTKTKLAMTYLLGKSNVLIFCLQATYENPEQTWNLNDIYKFCKMVCPDLTNTWLFGVLCLLVEYM